MTPSRSRPSTLAGASLSPAWTAARAASTSPWRSSFCASAKCSLAAEVAGLGLDIEDAGGFDCAVPTADEGIAAGAATRREDTKHRGAEAQRRKKRSTQRWRLFLDA